MKTKALVIIVLSAAIIAATQLVSSPARAYPGQPCLYNIDCSDIREVCYKSNAISGVCVLPPNQF